MKRRIRLTESQLRNIIRKNIKSVINEGRSRFLQQKFNEWANTDQIPEDVMNKVRQITEKVGYPIEEEEVIPLCNRYGETYAYAKGFYVTYCTSSLANGPSKDYSKILIQQLKGLGFEKTRGYGDNGLDSTTHYRDTYWTYEFIYKPSFVDLQQFKEYEGDDDEDDDYDDPYEHYY